MSYLIKTNQKDFMAFNYYKLTEFFCELNFNDVNMKLQYTLNQQTILNTHNSTFTYDWSLRDLVRNSTGKMATVRTCLCLCAVWEDRENSYCLSLSLLLLFFAGSSLNGCCCSVFSTGLLVITILGTQTQRQLKPPGCETPCPNSLGLKKRETCATTINIL